jgi:zinc transport system permease protein
VVGALLVTALLVIPPAAARAIARSPEQVALFGAGVGALSVIGGLMGSWHADSPAGPSVVMTAVALFGLLHVFSRLKR